MGYVVQGKRVLHNSQETEPLASGQLFSVEFAILTSSLLAVILRQEKPDGLGDADGSSDFAVWFWKSCSGEVFSRHILFALIVCRQKLGHL